MKKASKKELISSPVRYKKLRGKKVALCDYKGECKNKAYREAYP